MYKIIFNIILYIILILYFMNNNNYTNSSNLIIFIDADNVSPKHYQYILEELKKEGRVISQKLYGDFSKNEAQKWKDIIFDYGIEAVQVFRIPRKESTDNSLIVDSMKYLSNKNIFNVFCIISSDSDYSSLAREIRENGKKCIGVGYSQTPLKLRNNCDNFIVIENILDNSAYNLNDITDSSDNITQTNKDSNKEINKGTNKNINSLNRLRNATSLYNLIEEIFNVFNRKYISTKELYEFIKKHNLDNKFNMSIENEDILERKCSGVQCIKIKNKVFYDIRLVNNKLLTNVIYDIIESSDKDEILMSYLKENILRVDNSFSQKNYKFEKMVDFIRVLIVSGNNTNYYYINKNNKNEYIIGRKNSRFIGDNNKSNILKGNDNINSNISDNNSDNSDSSSETEMSISPQQFSYAEILKNN